MTGTPDRRRRAVINKIEVKSSIETLGMQGPEVIIDGHRLPGVRSADVSTQVGFIPTVTVELHAHAVHVDGELRFVLGENTVEALRKLGWTAPAGDPSGAQP